MIDKLMLHLIVGAVALAVGFSGAWYAQGVRLTAAEQKHTEYVQEQERRALAAERAANEQRDETAKAWAANLDALRARYRAGWLPKLPTGAGLRVPPAGRADEAGADAIPAPRADAPAVVEQCAETTLQLNALQEDLSRYLAR